MAYNMSTFEACTNLFCSFSSVNILSGGYLVNLGVIVLWAILFFNLLRQNPPPESFAASSAVCAIVTLLCLALQLTTPIWLFGWVFLFAMSAIGVYLRNKTT